MVTLAEPGMKMQSSKCLVTALYWPLHGQVALNVSLAGHATWAEQIDRPIDLSQKTGVSWVGQIFGRVSWDGKQHFWHMRCPYCEHCQTWSIKCSLPLHSTLINSLLFSVTMTNLTERWVTKTLLLESSGILAVFGPTVAELVLAGGDWVGFIRIYSLCLNQWVCMLMDNYFGIKFLIGGC